MEKPLEVELIGRFAFRLLSMATSGRSGSPLGSSTTNKKMESERWQSKGKSANWDVLMNLDASIAMCQNWDSLFLVLL